MDLIPFLKRCFALACCFAGLFLFCWIVSETSSSEMSSRKPSDELIRADSKREGESCDLVEEIIKFVIGGDINSAEEIFIQEDFRNLCGKNLYDYFEYFFAYLKNSKKSGIKETYFISSRRFVEEYFKDKKYSDEVAFRLSEQIPYYIAKNYVQKKSKYSEMLDFASNYKESFSRFDSISKETADVICLYFYADYKNSKTNKDWLKSEINEISAVQQRYPSSLGDNGTYARQRAYLKNLSEFLERKANSLIDRPLKAFFFWRRLERCPVYEF